MGSSNFWHPWQQSLGRIPLHYKTKHFWFLKTGVGVKPWGARTIVRRSTLWNPPPHHWFIQRMHTFGSMWDLGLKAGRAHHHCPWLRPEGRRAFRHVKLKKKKKIAWNWEGKKKEEKDHVLIKPWKMKRTQLRKPATRLRVWKYESRAATSGGELWERGRYRAVSQGSLSSSLHTLPSPHVLYLFSHRLWRPSESSTTQLKHPEHSTLAF